MFWLYLCYSYQQQFLQLMCNAQLTYVKYFPRSKMETAVLLWQSNPLKSKSVQHSLLSIQVLFCRIRFAMCPYSDLLAHWSAMELDYLPSWLSIMAHSIYLQLSSIYGSLWRTYHIMLTWEPFNKTIHVNHDTLQLTTLSLNTGLLLRYKSMS